MRIAMQDLRDLLDFVAKRSTDVAITLDLDGHECKAVFGDIDGQIVTATLYGHETNRLARVTSTETLGVALKALRRPL